MFVILLLINIFNEIFFRQSEGRQGANLIHPIFSQVLNVVCFSVVVIESEPLFELVSQIKSNHMNTNTYSQGEKRESTYRAQSQLIVARHLNISQGRVLSTIELNRVNRAPNESEK